MTSKEALIKLNEMACDGNDNATQKYANSLKEIIKKDLEILDILKTHYRYSDSINEDFLVLVKPISQKEADIIKEGFNECIIKNTHY